MIMMTMKLKQEIIDQLDQACCSKAEKKSLGYKLDTRVWEEGELRQILKGLRRQYEKDAESFFNIARPILIEAEHRSKDSLVPKHQRAVDIAADSKAEVKKKLKALKIHLEPDRLKENLEKLAQTI